MKFDKEFPATEFDGRIEETTSMNSGLFLKIFMTIGVVMMLFGSFLVYEGYMSTRWPTVTGEIVTSKIVGYGRHKKAKIEYRYMVGNQTFRGDHIYAGTSIMSQGKSYTKLAREYPVGKRVQVYYDPKNPQNAALKKGVKLDALVLIGMGLMFFMIAMLINRGSQVSEELSLESLNQTYKLEELGLSGQGESYIPETKQPKTPSARLKLLSSLVSVAVFVLFAVFFFKPVFFPGKKTTSYVNRSVTAHQVKKATSSRHASGHATDIKEEYKAAKSLYDKGVKYLQGKNYKEAERTFRSTLAMLDKIGGTSLPAYPTVQNTLAYSLYQQGRLDEAEKLYKNSIAILEKKGKTEELGVARACEGLARIYLKEGKLAEIEPLYKRAIMIWDKVRVPNNGNTLSIKSQYAYLLDRLGRHEEAAKMREEVKIARSKWREKDRLHQKNQESKN